MAKRFPPAIKWGLAACLLAGVAAVVICLPSKPLPSVLLPDGRLLQVAGISYGTVHRIVPVRAFSTR